MLCKKVVKENGYETGVGDEGRIRSVLQARQRRAVSSDRGSWSKPLATSSGEQIFLGMDLASSEFYDEGKKVICMR
jgi:enolase